MDFTGYRALVVDDEPYVRDLTTRALSRRALQCDTAANGVEALLLARQYRYDIVITDLRMPEMNGHALATELLAWPSRPKVMVLTGLQEPLLVQDLQRRGVDEVLQKPIDYGELVTRVLMQIDPSLLIEANGSGPQAEARTSKIEASLIEVTEMFAERLEGIFNADESVIAPPPAVNDYIDRLDEEEAIQMQSGDNPNAAAARRHERVRVQARALAVPVDRHFQKAGEPFAVAVRDVSESGVRLMHTRATNAEYLALRWQCATIPYRNIEVVARVVRCLPLSRFYSFGCQFVLAD